MSVQKEIINQCKKNNEKAQAYIFKKYASELLAVCMRYFKDKSKAEDVMQDAFITIFSKIKQFKGTGSFEGWIKRITVNTALIQIRKDKKEIISDNFDFIESENKNNEHEKNFDPKDIKSVIEKANFKHFEIIETVNELPKGFKTIFNLYVIEGFMHKEIAEKLGISEGTSKSQLMRARTKLKKLLYKKALKKLKNSKQKTK